MSSDREAALLRAAAARVSGGAAGPCPEPGRWVELAAGRLAEADADALREHLAACADCLETAVDARRFLAALATPDRPQSRGTLLAWPLPSATARIVRRVAAVLVLAAGAVLATVVARNPRLGVLSIEKAAYQAIQPDEAEVLYRDSEGVDPAVEASLAAAMATYQRDQFAAAAAALGRHLAAYPHDQRARFYRGVSLLLIGRDRAAADELAVVAALAAPVLAGEARWYRALALLRLGDREQARAELGTLAAGTGPRREAAERWLAATADARRQ